MFSVFGRKKVTVDENVSFTDYVSGIRLPDCSKLAKNRKNNNYVTICWYDVITKIFFEIVLFFLSSLVTGPSFMSISSLVLELWQFSFIRDWPKIRKSEIPSFQFSPIFGDRGKLGIPNLAWIPLIKYYWMLQNARITAFTVSDLLRENQQRVKLPTQTRIKSFKKWN